MKRKALCLCGSIEFEFEDKKAFVVNCHCTLCRRSHGADYAPQIMASKKSLSFFKGQTLVNEFASSEYGRRCFCSVCGARLYNYSIHGNFMSVALNALSPTPELTPNCQIFTSSKAPWCPISEAISSFAEYPDNIQEFI